MCNELRAMTSLASVGGRHTERGPHTQKEALTQLRKELGVTRMELQDAKGKLSRASRETGRVLEMLRLTTSSPAPIDLPSEA